MKKKIIGRRWAMGLLAPLVGIIGLAAGGYAFGRPFGGGHGHRMFGRVLHHLDLTEEQEVLVVRMRRAMHEEKKSVHSDLRGVWKAAQGQLAKEEVDPAEAHALVDQGVERMKQGLHKAVDEYLEIHKTLSSAQRAKLVKGLEKMDRRMKRFHKGHGDWPEDTPPAVR